MKILQKSAPVLFLLFLLLMTAISAVFLNRGFTFAVSSSLVWLLLNLAVEAALITLCAAGRKIAAKPMRIVAQFLPLGALAYFLATRLLLDNVSILLIVFHGLLCFTSCFILSMIYAKPRVVRIVSAVLNVVVLLVLLQVSIASVFFSINSMRDKDMVIRRVPSPEQSYTAVITSVNHGARGRFTQVDAYYDYAVIDLGLGRFQKTVGLYTDSGNAYTTMSLEWEDETTLLINGEAYTVE